MNDRPPNLLDFFSELERMSIELREVCVRGFEAGVAGLRPIIRGKTFLLCLTMERRDLMC